MAVADFLVTLGTFIAIYSLFGLGLNVKYGFTGLIDFGHVVYFMVGSYVTVVLTMPPGAAGYTGLGGFGLPALLGGLFPGGAFVGWLLGLAGGMVAAALVSLLVGIPTLRLREDYLAITALGIATIINSVFTNEEWLFNGPFGISSVYMPLHGVFPLSLGSFTLNMAVFGGLSVLAFGYLGYRTARYVAGVDRRAAGIVTAGVVLLGGGLAAFAANQYRIAGVLGLLAGIAAVAQSVRSAATPGKVLALGAAEAFVAWYFGTSFVQGGLVQVQRNLMWLFAIGAGPAGGIGYDRFLLLIAMLLTALSYYWVQRTVNSPYGRILRGIRDDEEVPQALGKHTYRYKIQSLLFGSGLAGAAGGLWALHLGFISPGQFTSTLTFYAFTAVIIGGTANNSGVILGTVVFWTLHTGTRFLNDYFPTKFATQLAAARLILIGLLLIVILYYRPEGLLGEQDYDVGVSLPDGGEVDD